MVGGVHPTETYRIFFVCFASFANIFYWVLYLWTPVVSEDQKPVTQVVCLSLG